MYQLNNNVGCNLYDVFNRLMLFTYLFLRDKLFNLYYISI